MTDSSPSSQPMRRRNRITHLRRSARRTTTQWRRTLICWGAAIIVGIIAVAFAAAANQAGHYCLMLVHWNKWAMLGIIPAGLALSTWLTRNFFPGAQGSGIPQVIATLHIENFKIVKIILSLKIAFGKILMTLLGLLCGASIGREGPTVQVGASIMHYFGQFMGNANVSARRGMILAGGAAGVSAAFNTPLAGIVFAIEELSHSFEQRASGTALTSVVLSGVTALALIGNYTYFGHTTVDVPLGTAWMAVLACGIIGGLAGGTFSSILIRSAKGLPGKVGHLIAQYPILFAAFCGFLLAIIGLISNGATYGTGYEQARAIINGTEHYPISFSILKFLSTIISYCSGIPGGLFAPSLAIGAGIGGWVAHFLPHTSPGAVVLLGMVAYFCGVVQAPLTSTVIVMEMCDNQQVTLALMATSFLAYGVSRMVSSHSLYSSLADRFMEAQDTTLLQEHQKLKKHPDLPSELSEKEEASKPRTNS